MSYLTLNHPQRILFGKTSMPDPLIPSPPENTPQYLAEGIPKQDHETLTDLQSWIDELLAYRNNITDEDIKPDAGEIIEDIKETDSGTVVKTVSLSAAGAGRRRRPFWI